MSTTAENPRHPNEFPVNAGTPVMSRDGTRLGKVAEVLSGHFKVEAESGSDYWLAKSSLAEANESAAIVSFDNDNLEPYKLDAPVAASADPVLDAASDAFGSQEELDRTRAAMKAGTGAPVNDNAGR